MAIGKFDASGYKIELKPVESVGAPRGQRLARLLFFGGFYKLALAQKPIDQDDAGDEFIVGLAVLMKLLFTFTDHGFGIAGLPFLNRQLRQGELRFCDSLLVSNLFAQSQRFLVRLAGCLQIPLIDEHVSGSVEGIGHGPFVINLLCDSAGVLVAAKGCLQVTAPSSNLGKIG